jgi:hypothetical protein
VTLLLASIVLLAQLPAGTVVVSPDGPVRTLARAL